MPSRRDEINEQLKLVNDMVFGPGSRLKLEYVNFAECREQDINANVMPTGMFNQLVANIKKSGMPETIPLMATRSDSPEDIEIVSGHHRTRASMQAGIEGGLAFVYRGLTNSEIRAKQLAHNSLNGTSDPEIVREIFAQITDVEDKIESFIDPNAFDDIPEAIGFDMVDIDPLADAKTVTVVFMPTQLSDFSTAIDLLSSQPPTALAAMARLALERLAQIKAEREQAGPDAPVEIPEPSLSASLIEALT
jgi:ParB-like chromosome segregation protein Spo0J